MNTTHHSAGLAAPTQVAASVRASHWLWPSRGEDWSFARKVLIALGLGALAYAAWKLAYVLMLFFASILLAIILRAIAERIQQWTGMRRSWAISLTTVGLFALLAGFAYVFGSQLVSQFNLVMERLPDALDKLGERLGMDLSIEALENYARKFASTSGLPGAVGYGSTAVGALADFFIILVGGIYLASDAKTYQRGMALLLPQPQRERVRAASGDAAHALTLWFFGQLVAMVAVGLASWAAYAWIGLPSAGVLALIAGASDFVPMIGPIVGGIPALIVASTQGGETFLWTLGAIVVIQQLESYVLMPIVQKRAIDLPPAVGIFAIVIFGSLFGVIGVVLAVPLAVLLFVLVQRLWVNEVLGEDVEVIGQDKAQSDGEGSATGAFA